jgi:integrase/recombinase XerC/integrase/recombinase XerD
VPVSESLAVACSPVAVSIAVTVAPPAGASAPLLMTESGHSSLRTLGKYARPGTEALAAWQQQTDRTCRGRA